MSNLSDLLNPNDVAWYHDPRRPCAPPTHLTPQEQRDWTDCWFPTVQLGRKHAARLCAGCPAEVKAACLAEALENKEEGIWAGTNEEMRKELRKDGAAA